jgi:hypothetical protein
MQSASTCTEYGSFLDLDLGVAQLMPIRC